MDESGNGGWGKWQKYGVRKTVKKIVDMTIEDYGKKHKGLGGDEGAQRTSQRTTSETTRHNN